MSPYSSPTLEDDAFKEGLTNNLVDASHPLPGPRFSQILASFKSVTPSSANISSSPKQSRSLPELLENLIHFSTPTLAHLIALFSQEIPTHPPQKTSLIIVDSFSTLISNAFPRSHDANVTPRKPGGTFLRSCLATSPRFGPISSLYSQDISY
jgi:hypothetical protein